jgi:Cft2 family RNA processing exonuclease
MLNRTARAAFDDYLIQAEAMPSAHELGSEHVLGWAAGLVAYALFAGDINHKESTLLHTRIQAVRSRRVVMLCQEARRATA